MSVAITYAALGPDEARASLQALKAIYATVFSLPPYNEGPEMADRFVGWVHDESRHPGFKMVIARCDEQPVGFAYGYTMPAGEWFRSTDRPAPAEIKETEKFAVMEWAVVPEHRGHGIGRVLMESLLDGRSEPWAVLTVNPAAQAREIYEKAGWKQVATTAPGRAWPAMNVMVLDRRDRDGEVVPEAP